MKKTLALAALALALCSTLSCEQQTWEQTKMFKQTRHAHGHDDAHGAHGAKDGHAAPAAGTDAAKPAAH